MKHHTRIYYTEEEKDLMCDRGSAYHSANGLPRLRVVRCRVTGKGIYSTEACTLRLPHWLSAIRGM